MNSRRDTLSGVWGDILEIGFGTGMNLAYYPAHVRKITAIDVSTSLHGKAKKRMKSSALVVNYGVHSAESLPFPDGSFDTVVSTFTLCSIGNVHQALSEIVRVLRPDGRLFFAEHGLSPDPLVQKWQHRLNPVHKMLSCGCNLNRDIGGLVVAHDLTMVTLNRFYLEGVPRIFGYMYQGSARKNAR